VVNILLLKGSIGIEGGGTCPVRGHSNVQGDRTMNIWEKPKPAFIDRLSAHFNTEFPKEHGWDAVESIEAAHAGKVKFYFFMGGNFVSATPDSVFTAEAIQKCDMTVQVSTKLNRSHVITGKEALILPCVSRSEKDVQASGEQFVTIENSMGVVQKSYGRLENASGNLMSEPAIVAAIGKALYGNDPINWEKFVQNYDHIRDAVEATIDGFEDYNKRVRKPGGFYLPNGARERRFNTTNGKANFTINAVPDRKVKEDHLIMMTIRTHDQYNTTIYGNDDRYRGILNERRVVLMNEKDMEKHGLKELDVVNIIGHHGGNERRAHFFKIVKYDISEGCVATYFPEANVLVPIESTARTSNTPVSKFIEVSLEKA
jgi:molybdopterin-dependent oxidoreductase alpha subunit